MTADEAVELGKAWPAWQWAPGQALIDVDGDEGVVVHVVGRRLRVAYGCVGSGRQWTDLLAWQQAGECVPDLRDPGTRGHALEQVREAWGDRYTLTVNPSGIIDIWCIETANSVFYAKRPTMAEALLAAWLDDDGGSP